MTKGGDAQHPSRRNGRKRFTSCGYYTRAGCEPEGHRQPLLMFSSPLREMALRTRPQMLRDFMLLELPSYPRDRPIHSGVQDSILHITVVYPSVHLRHSVIILSIVKSNVGQSNNSVGPIGLTQKLGH